MREIMRNFEAHTQQQHSSHNRISKFKLRLYSGHDSTIATILQVFGVYNHQLVPYTGTVLIELYKRSYKTDEPSCPQIPDPFSDMYFIKVHINFLCYIYICKSFILSKYEEMWKYVNCSFSTKTVPHKICYMRYRFLTVAILRNHQILILDRVAASKNCDK